MKRYDEKDIKNIDKKQQDFIDKKKKGKSKNKDKDNRLEDGITKKA